MHQYYILKIKEINEDKIEIEELIHGQILNLIQSWKKLTMKLMLMLVGN